MSEQQSPYKTGNPEADEALEKSLADWQEYFVLDEKTGDLFIREDFKKHIKEFKGMYKLQLLLKIMFFNPGDSTDVDEINEYLENIKRFEGGESPYYKLRREYYGMRDALLDALIERDGYYCRECNSTENITIDHIVPVVRGGKNLMSNLQLLCRSCNSRKGAK